MPSASCPFQATTAFKNLSKLTIFFMKSWTWLYSILWTKDSNMWSWYSIRFKSSINSSINSMYHVILASLIYLCNFSGHVSSDWVWIPSKTLQKTLYDLNQYIIQFVSLKCNFTPLIGKWYPLRVAFLSISPFFLSYSYRIVRRKYLKGKLGDRSKTLVL